MEETRQYIYISTRKFVSTISVFLSAAVTLPSLSLGSSFALTVAVDSAPAWQHGGDGSPQPAHSVKKSSVGDIPNGYTSDVVLNQQVRVAHQGGMADCLPDGPVAGEIMAVLDAGAHGGSEDRPMAGCLVVHA
jgi:hypothetical protein